MVNAQEWLDKNYPSEGVCQKKDESSNVNNFGKKRDEITELIINRENLTGSFQLTGFNKLTKLFIINNNFTDLSILSSLVNLESLWTNNNSWTGSFQPLQNLSKLKSFCVLKTHLTGLEYLPESLEKFWCDGQLAEELTVYGQPDGTFNSNYLSLLRAWKRAHPDLMTRAQEIKGLTNTLTNLKLALSNQTPNETTDKTLQIFIFQTEEKIKELKKENQAYYESKVEIPPKN